MDEYGSDRATVVPEKSAIALPLQLKLTVYLKLGDLVEPIYR
jgi:hypothetical protein